MIQPGRAVFDPDRYTERGKWMDGWESRRKRVPGHDFCVLELGAPGRVYGFDVDTSHFVGNHPPFAVIEGLRAPAGTPLSELLARSWVKLLPQSPLGPGCQNLFAAEPCEAVSHVRLSVYPDGGVRSLARLRQGGARRRGARAPSSRATSSRAEKSRPASSISPRSRTARSHSPAPTRASATCKACSFRGARVMGEGWETRRGRPPDHRHDWILIQLAERGTVEAIEVDTNHYKGNYPERCSIEFIDAASASLRI